MRQGLSDALYGRDCVSGDFAMGPARQTQRLRARVLCGGLQENLSRSETSVAHYRCAPAYLSLMHPFARADIGPPDPTVALRIDALIDEGNEIWERFDRDVRTRQWHPFVASDYAVVLQALSALRAPGLSFLEWGSATGVITIMADLLGFDAVGIELDRDLVATARELAARFDSRARFLIGSFIPVGYRPQRKNGDGRLGTIGDGASAYAEMGRGLDDFDLVYGYPWKGEEPTMLNVMAQYGHPSARLLLHTDHGITIYRGGRAERVDEAPG
jgi:hypothetical protein